MFCFVFVDVCSTQVSDRDRYTYICRVKQRRNTNKRIPDHRKVINRTNHNKAFICKDTTNNGVFSLQKQLLDTGNGMGTMKLVGPFVVDIVPGAPSQAMESCHNQSHGEIADLMPNKIIKLVIRSISIRIRYLI